MSRTLAKTVSLSLFLLLHCSLAQGRKWVDTTGSHTLEATFVSMEGQVVRLKKENGELLTIPLRMLGKADQAYLASHAQEQAKTLAPATTPSQASKAGFEPRADDWPMGGWDSGNSFCNVNEKTLAPPLAKVWECKLPGHLDSFSVRSGVVLASAMGEGKKNVAFAVDARNGRQLWSFTLPGGGKGAMSVSPACTEDVAYFGGQGDDNVYAVDLQTGKVRWQGGDIKSMYSCSPKIAEGLVYANSSQMRLLALDAATGEVRWRNGQGRQSDIAVKSGCVLRPGGAYGGPLMAIDATTGELQWKTVGPSCFAVAATDDLVFVSYGGDAPERVTVRGFERYRYDRIAAFRMRDGKKVWETELDEDAHRAGLLLLNDAVYVATFEGRIYRLDQQTGTVLTKRPVEGGRGKLVGTSNMLFTYTSNAILAIAPDSLETRWETPSYGYPHLIPANERLFVANGSRIVAYANAGSERARVADRPGVPGRGSADAGIASRSRLPDNASANSKSVARQLNGPPARTTPPQLEITANQAETKKVETSITTGKDSYEVTQPLSTIRLTNIRVDGHDMTTSAKHLHAKADPSETELTIEFDYFLRHQKSSEILQLILGVGTYAETFELVYQGIPGPRGRAGHYKGVLKVPTEVRESVKYPGRVGFGVVLYSTSCYTKEQAFQYIKNGSYDSRQHRIVRLNYK